jgi:hypothetical protein
MISTVERSVEMAAGKAAFYTLSHEMTSPGRYVI